MRIMIVTDAWRPQVNGVVRTLERLCVELARGGHEMRLVTPAEFFTVPMPTYREIRLSFATARMLRRRIAEFAPEHIHIATEGPLGVAANSACRKLGLPFTTSYHTRFPEYLRARLPVPVSWTYAWLRRFHNGGSVCLVATASIAGELAERGFTNLVMWTRGVDHELFRLRREGEPKEDFGFVRPVFLNVGRISVEKNLEAFLGLDLPGTKVVVGDGPARKRLERRFPDARFLGARSGVALARCYRAADVFVFPSLTDTFGNVLLEALASGLPVAAFPVPGPLDVIDGSGAGVLDADLGKAAMAALAIAPDRALERAAGFTWQECARIFVEAGLRAARTPE